MTHRTGNTSWITKIQADNIHNYEVDDTSIEGVTMSD